MYMHGSALLSRDLEGPMCRGLILRHPSSKKVPHSIELLPEVLERGWVVVKIEVMAKTTVDH